MYKAQRVFVTVILFSVLMLLTSCSFLATDERPGALNGVLDLSGWDFNRDGSIRLDGQWEFYWMQMLSASDIQDKAPDLYGNVPSVWNRYTIDGTYLHGEGHATYRLRVKTDLPAGTTLGVSLNTFSSAYRMFVNDELVASNGTVAASVQEEIGEYRPQAIMFNIPDSDFDIILQVSNYHYARGGFWYSIYLGDANHIVNLHIQAILKEAFLLGALLIIALLYFAIYFFCRDMRYTLYFALFCLLLIIGIDIMAQFILVRFLFFFGFKAIVFLWYSSVIWILLSFILYHQALYPSRISSIIVKISAICAILIQLSYILRPIQVYTQLGLVNRSMETIGFIFIFVIIVIGIRKGKREAWVNILSMLIVSLTYFHDIMFWRNLINHGFGEIFHIGVYVFLFIQVCIQAYRIKLYHDQKNTAELAFLQAQIKSHFVYNALNTFISIARVDIDKAVQLLVDFCTYLRKSFDFKDSNQFVSLKHDLDLVRAYLNVQKARFEDRLEMVFDIEEEYLDIKVPCLVLQPIIENAVIHGICQKDTGGTIYVTIKRQGAAIVFSVKDTGVGMDKRLIDQALNEEIPGHIGFANIERRLRKHYRKGLSITSVPSSGTEVTYRIPLR